MVAAAAAGARAANEQPRAAAMPSVSNAPLATKRRAGTEGRFNCAFGPGLYYQPGLKGGATRATARGTLWSRLVTRTVTKCPYPTVSLGATGH